MDATESGNDYTERIYTVKETPVDPKRLAFQEWDGRVGLRAAPLIAPDPCIICGSQYSACNHNHQGASNV